GLRPRPGAVPDQAVEPGERLAHQRVEPVRRLGHPAGGARQQDVVLRRRLEDQPGDPDQVGPELHQGPLPDALWRLAALPGHRLVLDPTNTRNVVWRVVPGFATSGV